VKESTPSLWLRRIEAQLENFAPPVREFEADIRRDPFRILVSVLISSRTRDEVTLAASRRLFAAAATPERMRVLGVGRIEELIFPVGFYRQKARQIVRLCERLETAGGIPDTYPGLVSLPGVGRKTANLVLSLAFNRPAIAVDTHVFRISRRLGWAEGLTAESVEEELRGRFPREDWSRLNQVLVGFGQVICTPRNPSCRICTLTNDCPHAARTRRNGPGG